MPKDSSPITRFAPSPTGLLHLGHLASAMAVNTFAQKYAAKQVLRIEDNDFTRSKPEFTNAIIQTLLNFGLEYDGTAVFQADKTEQYAAQLARLKTKDLVYPCYRTRAQLPKGIRRGEREVDNSPTFNGRAAKPAWRLDISACLTHIGVMPHWQELPWSVAFESDNASNNTQSISHPLRDQNDPILWRRDGVPAYLLCSTWDDITQGITHIIRGEDTRHFTPLQALLYHVWQVPTPVYCFHPIVQNQRGEKLSKSKNAKSLADYRAEGLSATEIIALARFPI